jgi:hypothetical protein
MIRWQSPPKDRLHDEIQKRTLALLPPTFLQRFDDKYGCRDEIDKQYDDAWKSVVWFGPSRPSYQTKRILVLKANLQDYIEEFENNIGNPLYGMLNIAFRIVIRDLYKSGALDQD